MSGSRPPRQPTMDSFRSVLLFAGSEVCLVMVHEDALVAPCNTYLFGTLRCSVLRVHQPDGVEHCWVLPSAVAARAVYITTKQPPLVHCRSAVPHTTAVERFAARANTGGEYLIDRAHLCAACLARTVEQALARGGWNLPQMLEAIAAATLVRGPTVTSLASLLTHFNVRTAPTETAVDHHDNNEIDPRPQRQTVQLVRSVLTREMGEWVRVVLPPLLCEERQHLEAHIKEVMQTIDVGAEIRDALFSTAMTEVMANF